MATTTRITNIAHLLDLGDYVGDFVEDYDMDAAHGEYVAAIEQAAVAAVGPGVWVLGNGEVLAEVTLADAVRDLDFGELAEQVDIDPILERHEKTSR